MFMATFYNYFANGVSISPEKCNKIVNYNKKNQFFHISELFNTFFFNICNYFFLKLVIASGMGFCIVQRTVATQAEIIVCRIFMTSTLLTFYFVSMGKCSFSRFRNIIDASVRLVLKTFSFV